MTVQRADLHNNWRERQRRRATVQQHIQQHGPWCPGWQRDGHWVEARLLQADHPQDVVLGGPGTGQTYRVLCHGCNTRKGVAARVIARGETPGGKRKQRGRGWRPRPPRDDSDTVDLSW